MNNSFIVIDNIKNQKFNFKKILTKKDSFMWKNCSNLKINIKSKINKLIFINCKDIKLKIADTISGLEIENSKNIDIKCKINTSIKHLSSYKSNINLRLYENQEKTITFDIDKSKININKKTI